jgi:hypothetical protein
VEFLIADPVPVAGLHGAGVLVRVPQSANYAAHKLIVASRRPANDPKIQKDLSQAAQIIDAMIKAGMSTAIEDAFADARANGPAWRSAMDKSQRALDALRSSPAARPPRALVKKATKKKARVRASAKGIA